MKKVKYSTFFGVFFKEVYIQMILLSRVSKDSYVVIELLKITCEMLYSENKLEIEELS